LEEDLFSYPFNSLPPLNCHISPPLAVINGGPKLSGLDLLGISSTYHGGESNATTHERLALLHGIWRRITGAKELPKKWDKENREKQRKQDPDDDDRETSAKLISSFSQVTMEGYSG
jgi:hypothetical protein